MLCRRPRIRAWLAGGAGGVEKAPPSVGGLFDAPAGGRTGVAPGEANVEVGLDAEHTGDGGHRRLELAGLPIRCGDPVQQRDVVFDQHVDVRKVEPLFHRSDRRPDPIGEHQVGHVGVGMPRPQSVTSTSTLQATGEVSHPAGDHVELAAQDPVCSGAGAQQQPDAGGGRESGSCSSCSCTIS